MLRLAKLPVMFAVLVCAPFAIAQSTLGELLDTGAKKLSVDEFKQELVQRVIVGPSATGGSLEIIYTDSGQVAGTGTVRKGTLATMDAVRILGTWTIGGTEKVCTTLTFSLERGGAGTNPMGLGSLPPRCQFWFKLGDTYFISDSDSDRSARVLSRTVKQ